MLMVKEDFISKEEYVSRMETARCSTRELIPRSRRCSRSRRRSRRQRCILFWKRRRNAKAGFNPKTHKQGGRTYERTEVTLEHQREQINTLVFSTTHAQKKTPALPRNAAARARKISFVLFVHNCGNHGLYYYCNRGSHCTCSISFYPKIYGSCYSYYTENKRQKLTEND